LQAQSQQLKIKAEARLAGIRRAVNEKTQRPALTLREDLNPTRVTGEPSIAYIVTGIVEEEKMIGKMEKRIDP